MANMTVDQMVEELSSWSVMEVANLVKALEEHWGVSAAPAAVAAAAPAAGGGAEAEAQEEQTEFDVNLKSAGSKKINVIKVVRELMNLGLADAKNLVEDAPKTLKEGITKEEADDFKKKIEEAGGEVEIK